MLLNNIETRELMETNGGAGSAVVLKELLKGGLVIEKPEDFEHGKIGINPPIKRLAEI